MSRINGLFVAIVFCAAASTPARGDTFTFKIATLAPDGSAWMEQMRAGAREIEMRSAGRVKFKFYPGGVMGNDQSVMRKIRIGQLHGAAFTGGGISDVYPDAQIYGLPFLFRDTGEVDYVREHLDGTFERGLEEAGFVSFGIADGGFAHVMSSVPVRSLDDLKGQKAWVPEGDRVSYAVMEAINVSPVTLPLTDVLTGLQTGLITVVASSPLGAIAFQWHTRIRYVTDVPLAYLYGIFAIDRRSFLRLSAADQAVMREVMAGVFRRLNAINRADNQRAREALVKQGVVFVTPPEGELIRWRAVADRVVADLAARRAYTPELLARVQTLLSEYRAATPAAAHMKGH
ncbi:MAG TPA: TRAP transporter substrate-binding protein DctP [Gammaproteobacteria bacterium]|nr:TRAP transporter substrate-binding protein DctP [Gammaproteobacteria bacterium]